MAVDPARHPFKARLRAVKGAPGPLPCDTCGQPEAAHGKPAHRDNLPPLHVPEAPAIVYTRFPAPAAKLDPEAWFRFFLTPDVYIDVNLVRNGGQLALEVRGEGHLRVMPRFSNSILVEVVSRDT